MRNAIIAVLVVLLLTISNAYAQQQPAEATNAQDEVLRIEAPRVGRDGVLTVFRSGDKEEINHYVSKVVELSHGVAYEILPHVLKAVRLERGAARVMKYTPPDGGEKRYFIQIVTTERQMRSIVETIKALDLPGVESSQGDAKYAIRMRYRPASEIATILANTNLSGEGDVFADDVTNTLFLKDSVSDSRKSLAFLEFFDVPTPQVEFDVQIIEVSDEDTGKLGLDWEAWKRSLGGAVNGTFNWFEGGAKFARLDGLLSLDARVLAEFLNYATQRGNARIVKRAKVAGSNLTPAVINCSRRVPYYGYEREAQDAAVLTEVNPQVDAAGEVGRDDADYPLDDPRVVSITPASHFERVDLGVDEEGVAVTILPVIGTEMVMAHVAISANTVTGFDEMDRPIVSEQNVETVVTLQDQKTVCVGTIERQVDAKYRRGIPGLRDLPILKYLFSVEGTRVERSRMHVIVTPRFVNAAVFESRVMGDGAPILKKVDPSIPEYIKGSMLPIE